MGSKGILDIYYCLLVERVGGSATSSVLALSLKI
jgi:hypothetical protein